MKDKFIIERMKFSRSNAYDLWMAFFDNPVNQVFANQFLPSSLKIDSLGRLSDLLIEAGNKYKSETNTYMVWQVTDSVLGECIALIVFGSTGKQIPPDSFFIITQPWNYLGSKETIFKIINEFLRGEYIPKSVKEIKFILNKNFPKSQNFIDGLKLQAKEGLILEDYTGKKEKLLVFVSNRSLKNLLKHSKSKAPYDPDYIPRPGEFPKIKPKTFFFK